MTRKGRMEDAGCLLQDVPVQRDLALVNLTDAATSSRPYSYAAQELVVVLDTAAVNDEVVVWLRIEMDNRVLGRTDGILAFVRGNQNEEELEASLLLGLLVSYRQDLLGAHLTERFPNDSPYASEVKPSVMNHWDAVPHP